MDQPSHANRAQHVRSIDGLRGLAVLGVIVWHGVVLFQLRHFGTVTAAPYGSRGVDLFFVISGLCLTLPAFAKNATRIQTRAFFVRRLVRIAPAYYAAVALFALLAFTPFGVPASHMLAGSPAFFRELGHEFVFLDSANPDLNPSFWTIAIEMRWYLLCPLLFALYRRSRYAFAALAVALYVLYQTPYSIADMGTLPAFMLGIVAADVAINRPRAMRFAWPAAIVSIACAAYFDGGKADHGDPLWHGAAFFLVLSALSTLRGAFSFRPLVAVGVASYSIYLVHQPLLEVAYRVTALPLATALAIAGGFVFWKAIEVPLLARRASAEGALDTLSAAFTAFARRCRELARAGRLSATD